MKKRHYFSILIFILLFLVQESYSQNITQIIRGKVVDSDTKTPLPFANIVVRATNPTIGTISDINGIFRMDKVPIGRHDILASFMEYETKIIPEL